jgi:hypothetical protein
VKKKRCISIVSDRDCRYYVIPTTKETKFRAWEASVIGGENDEYMDENYERTGEDFLDYLIDSPLGTLLLSNPYRRFRQRRARLRGHRDISDVRDVRDN